MDNIKSNIENILKNTAIENQTKISTLTDIVKLTEYKSDDGIWTEAFQKAINEHQVVIIPSSDKPYYIDNSLLIPSNRRIIAEAGATIHLTDATKVLMLRNTNTQDGTHAPITAPRNENVSIEGGRWEDWCPHRMGYGNSGKYDEQRSFYGVSTCMLLENIENLTLKNMVFKNCGGFAVQIGEAKNVIIENIIFENCFADGIHVNGNVENIHIKNVRGEVGDDLVAFNMYDWQDSSINFGPLKNAICEDLTLSPNSHYKAIRIEPGIYTFDDGSQVDCSLTNAIFRRIHNIKTYKLYCQTPPYSPGNNPEKGDVGSGDNIFFEDINVNLDAPIDLIGGYVTNDETTGTFAAFELGLNAKNIYFKNINLTLHREKYPYSYLMCIGPKSVRFDDGREVFDPYFSSTVENIHLENITVNGEKPADITPFVKQIEFNNLYTDIPSTASGKIQNIIYK